MATRSVRLDDEAETALTEVTQITGESISESIKYGLFLYQQEVKANRKPANFFKNRQLQGGQTLGDARDISALLKKKLKMDQAK